MADNMSFLPEDYLAKRLARRTNIICLSLFGIVALGLWATFFVDRAQRQEVADRLDLVNKEFEEAAKRLQQLEDLQAKKLEWSRKAQVAAVLIERVPRTLILSELVNYMPGTLSLQDFHLKTEMLKASSAPASRVQLEKAKNTKKAAAAAAAKAGQEVPVEAPKAKVALEMTGYAPTDVEIAEYITALSGHAMFRDVSLKFSEQSKIADREMRKFGLAMTLNTDLDLRQIDPLKVARNLKMDPMGTNVKLTPLPGVSATPVSDSH